MNTFGSLPGSVAARNTGLAICAVLALLVHGAVLASIWSSSRFDRAFSGVSPSHGQNAMRVTLVKFSPAKPEAVARVLSAPVKQRQALHQELAGAASVVTPAKHDTQTMAPVALDRQLVIEYPDAPLPGGWLRMRVFVQLDAEGRIQTLLSDADPAAGAPFVEAVRRGLSAAAIAPPSSRHRASASHQCLELVFDEKHPEVKARTLQNKARKRIDCLGSSASETTAGGPATPVTL
jgi:hypothetical protein